MYFISWFYRDNAVFTFMTLRSVLRSIGKGFIYYFLHFWYGHELLLLGCVEINMVVLILLF